MDGDMTVNFSTMTNGQEERLTQTNLKVLSGADAVLSVAHYSPEGMLHGHTYTIRAWWINDAEGEMCVIKKQSDLNNWALVFDHAVMPKEFIRAEQLAVKCIKDLGAIRVEVMRPQEGIYAVVEAK
jgi:hypothetical protein